MPVAQGQMDGIIAPLANRYVAGVKARIREAQNDLHFQYEISEKEAEARKAADRSTTYQANHPRLVEIKEAMIKPKGSKKKAATGPFLGLLARTYTSETSGTQSLQIQLKKKIKQVNLKLARRMRTSESDYDQFVSASKDEDDFEAPTTEDAEDASGELEGSDAESVADEEEESPKAPLEVVDEEEEEVDAGTDDTDDADGDDTDDGEEVDDDDDDDDDDDEAREEQGDDDVDDEEEEEADDDNEHVQLAMTKLCIKAMKRMIIEEGI